MNTNLSRQLAVVSAILLLAVSLLTAQSYRARISGLVTDQTQAVVAGATVTLLNVHTGVKTVRQTNETGLYLFDLVDPGTYTLTVELAGFNRFVQENIVVQMRGDVTVNVTLQPGTVQESITVSESPVAVQFNSAAKDFTIDARLAAEIPRIDRNPFKLTLLAPSAINTRGEMMPFHSWAANSVDLGGGTNLKNDLQVDGSPIGIGHKNTYPPNIDAVQEVVVSQNPVDAESGHSAGGLISLTLKSGTNEWHGTAFYLGRYPWLNAIADRTRNVRIATRQHMMGGTLGNPILRNRLFNFFSLEYWKVRAPGSLVTTVPTALERDGDFSRSYNIDGGLRTIYDPWTTRLDPTTGRFLRTPFAGNVVPRSRFDSFASGLLKQFWDPNNPGDNITGVNNFKIGLINTWDYYNFSDRVDYNINDNWKVYGRVSRYHTDNTQTNPTPNNSALFVPTGSLRQANQVSGDAVWTMSPRTVVNFRGSWDNLVDARISPVFGSQGWASLWPNNPWYKVNHDASKGVPIYFPYLNIGGRGVFGGPGFYWDQRPKAMKFYGRIAQQRGSHYLKAGLEYRRSYGVTFVGNTERFFFPTGLTAETFISPDVRRHGDGFATFLLGALDDTSQVIGGPAPDPHIQFWGMFFQDDWKLNRRITVSFGIRNETETAWYDPDYNFSRGLDLSAPIPEMQANPPQMPPQALALVGSGFYRWNGQWLWTSKDQRGMWDPQRLALMPRAGVAIRIDDRTALRIGYGRFLIPYQQVLSQAPVPGFETVSFLEPPFFGMRRFQNTAPLRDGVPQQRISDPFPADVNPLLPVLGKGYGPHLGRGGEPLLWFPRDPLKKARNDRLSFNLQRQLPGEIVGSFTWFWNIGNQHYTRMNLNLVDPRILEREQSAARVSVPNPFFQYLNTTVFPGPLRNQRTVPLDSLLRPYPHYGGLYEVGTLGAAERYHSLEFKAQKAFTSGWNFLAAYVYIREKTQLFQNELDQFTNTLRYLDSNQPRHRVTAAGTWELPFGKGRAYWSDLPRAADAILGGWKLTGLLTYTSGAYLRFPKAIATGDPTIPNPTPERWFDTTKITPIASGVYMIRNNPWQYPGLTGPSFWVIDATVGKLFNVTERVKLELEMAAYNATNRLNLGNPDLSPVSPNFGKALFQGAPTATFGAQTMSMGTVTGRQVELGLKLIF